MRSLRLAGRLALRNLRRRPGQALLLLLTLTIATGVLGVATSLLGSADAPWDRVWRATNGFHVSLTVYHPPDEPGDRAYVEELRRRADQLVKAPGVTGVGGPWTHLYGSVEIAGGREDLTAEIREPGPSQVDQPLVTGGRWLGDDDGVVLESGLAATLHAGPGGTVGIQGRPFPVRGVATTVSRGRFPLSRPAQVWVTPGTAQKLRDLDMTEEGFELQLRLADPNDAAAFVAAHDSFQTTDPASSVVSYLETWRQRRADSHSDLDILAGTLFAAGTLIAMLTIATAAVLVAGRMAAQVRQVGTLKAVGVTPRQVLLVLLVEHLAIAAVATAVGLGVGRLLATPIAETSVTVLGRPEPPPLTWTRIAVVAAVAFAVVILGTVRPALRGIRQSTLRSLVSGPRPPRRPGRLARIAADAGVPLPGVLGMRSAWRRPGRLLTNAAGLLLGVAMIVVALALRGSLDLLNVTPPEPGHAASDAAVAVLYDQIRAIILGTAGLLLALGTINAFIVATFAARDAARNHAVLRAVGATPRQTVTALIVSQLGACAIAVVAGIPLGLGLWSLMDGGDLPPVTVPATSLLLLAAAVPAVFAAIVSVPALLLARRPVAPALAYE
ncbi:MAG TPA: FtsX-like permease family protein [Actinomycetota bacterium]|nr:FtsX-like permease family protein [Actinomycetota bacterium]